MANLEAAELQVAFFGGSAVSSMADLPHPNTSRWVARLKAQVVSGINQGLLSVGDACKIYNLTLEELGTWQRAVDRDGLPGLRATHAQRYRRLHEQPKRMIRSRQSAAPSLESAS
jgi:hypothetical protein